MIRILALCVVLLFACVGFAEEAVTPSPDEPTPDEVLHADLNETESPPLDPEETAPFELQISGEKTWTVRLGIGDSGVLGRRGLSSGLPVLEQTLRADIMGKALDVLTLEASFNDQLGPGFQRLELRLDRPPWHGVLGDFALGAQELGVYNKKLLGAQLAYRGEAITVTGLLAREQGISESLTFRGETSRHEILFSTRDPDDPWHPAPYNRSVEGLYYFALRYPFVEGFSEPELRLEISVGLRELLVAFELDYLWKWIEENPHTALARGEHQVIRSSDDILLLRDPPQMLLRKRVRDAISEHNRIHDLPDDERKRYPFVESSELEQTFLDELASHAHIHVDDEVYPLPEAQRRRYLHLRQQDIVEGSLELWVRPAGEEEFRPITEPEYADYSWELFAQEGILKIEFPETFFGEDAALRAAFSYARPSDVFMLGLSVVPGSERVQIGARQLKAGVDYSIDYESGMLILFRPLGPDEVLRVDFERQRGGLGGFAEYERAIYGLVLTVPGLDGLTVTLAQARDIGKPSAATRTMPNQHTVLATRMKGDIGDWQYTFNLGGSQNIFPPWDNSRVAGPNRINTIGAAESAGTDYVLLGHQRGLTVYDGTSYTTYDAAAGLGSQQVRDLVVVGEDLFVATEGGFAIVHLDEPSPFDRSGSWTRVRAADGFPGTHVAALATDGRRVFLATDEVIGVFLPQDAAIHPDWQRKVELPHGTVPTALHWAHGTLYIGSEEGLHSLQEQGLERITGVPGPVHGMASLGEELYVATGQGIRVLRAGSGAGWLAGGQDVRAVSVHESVVWYGTTRGLFRADTLEQILQGPITAARSVYGALWAGTQADDAYELDVWRVAESPTRIDQSTTRIDGRDTSRYFDLTPADRTAVGLSGGLILSRETGSWVWNIDLGSRWPGYQDIGRSDRTDAHGIGLALTYAGEGPWSGSTRVRWDSLGLWADPRNSLTGTLNLRWAPGPTYALTLSPSLEGPAGTLFGALDTGYTLTADWPGSTLSGKLAVAGRLTVPEWHTSGRLEGSLTLRPFEGWTVDTRAFRPYRTVGQVGDQGANVNIRWTKALELVSWTATWQESWRQRIGGAAWRSERSGRVDIRWESLSLGDARLTPSLTGDVSLGARETRWSARLNGRLRVTPSEWNLALSLGRGYRLDTERTDLTGSATMRWEYRGWDGLVPSARWQGTFETLSHPLHEDRTTLRQELELRLIWTPADGTRVDTTLTYRSRDTSWVLLNRVSWPSPIGTLSTDATLTWKEGDLDGRSSYSMGWSLGDMWRVNASVGFDFSLNQEDRFRQGLHAGVTLAAKF